MALDCFQVELDPDFPLAIPLERTAEVLSLQWSELCPVPGINAAFLGVSNQRGRLLWMVDVAALLGLTKREEIVSRPDKSTAIVLTHQESRIGVVVAGLRGLISLEESQLQSHPHPSVKAQTILDSKRIHVLDVDTVFRALQESELFVPPMVLA